MAADRRWHRSASPGSRERLGRNLSPTSAQQSCIYQLEFPKPETRGLGFTLTGGVNGSYFRVNDIRPGSMVAMNGRLRVGDVLLEVNGIMVSGLSRSKVLEILWAAEGTVRLTVHRDGLAVAGPEPEHGCPGITVGTDSEEEMTERQESPTSSRLPLCMLDKALEACDRNAFLSLQRDAASRQHKDQRDEWSSEDEEGEGDSDEDSLYPDSPLTERPIVSEEALSNLAVISPSENSQYSGVCLRALIQNLQHQLDQQDLIKEFMTLEHQRPADSCLVGNAAENREKNRYRDILPYDGTRVSVGEQQEYINASYIRMSMGPGERLCYICTQGPLPGTQACFWQMVWENRSDVIAMVTREVEHGRVKCHRYWPKKLHEVLDTGRYKLILDNYQRQDYFYIRMIKMVEKESGDIHLVRHLKFAAWPDHGVPRSCHQLVCFAHYMRAVHRTGPVIVHCSAGVGRAGVLICTDVILALIAKDLSINISSIVREMRLQRHGMVQTKEQYLFCYKVWLEVLQNIPVLCGTQWLQEKAS
ncbi:tyrosine-protein phosphatase non-receptor type 20 isoform X2 [Brienomyrus brachyistius]|uniref:tyrosine-protein phosphatase non-receptor type 20 isoform X2 n=1 Tax=Brienomyrus brachyistius TaxID=42636 RepID=UPI0020B43235|nr:tyrosine-protein phosphatase non-receptor type 20 isoform X2 [Brienomyrus brachyistius]